MYLKFYWHSTITFHLHCFEFQAKNVGVGGFFLGVGANPLGTSHRHGFGADTVIEYKLVLADGSIAIVSDFNTTIISRNGKR